MGNSNNYSLINCNVMEPRWEPICLGHVRPLGTIASWDIYIATAMLCRRNGYHAWNTTRVAWQ